MSSASAEVPSGHAGRDLGADAVIDRSGEDVAGRVAALTEGRGVDWIVDPAAGPTIPANIRLLAPSGMLVVHAALAGSPPHDLWDALWSSKSAALRRFDIHTWDGLVEERRAGMRTLIAMLAEGRLHPSIHGRLKLSEARQAHELLEQGAVTGKLLLQP